MAERALLSLITVALLIAAYYSFKKLQLRAVNRSTRRGGQQTEIPGVLYFWSPACTVCGTAQKPILDKLSERVGADRVQVTSVDVTEQPELASRYRVLTVPTTLVLDRHGEVKHMNNGLAKLDKLLQQLESCS